MIEWTRLGQNDKIRTRRFDILRMEETGLKPAEIRASLIASGYPEITIGKVYEDLKWARKHLGRDDREDIFDKHMIRQLTDRLDNDNERNPAIRMGIYKLIFRIRRDQRKRAGLYVEKIEIDARVEVSEELRIIRDHVNEELTPDSRKRLVKKLEDAKKHGGGLN